MKHNIESIQNRDWHFKCKKCGMIFVAYTKEKIMKMNDCVK